MKILVLNSGSSSQKSSLYEIGGALPEHPPAPLWAAKVEWREGSADIHVENSKADVFKDRVKIDSRHEALEHLLSSLWDGKAPIVTKPSEIDAVGHRIVHGGDRFEKPTGITDEVKDAIAHVSSFAPLHNRAELEGVKSIGRLLGGVPQVAVFDTGFHHTLPLASAVYPGPYEWWERGIRRYGFHGINHQYCAERTAQLLGKDIASLRIVTCHLGNGCSLAAIDGGRSVDTTMGFTPLDGLMMGTRSGSIDPGILTYLIRQNQVSGQELDDLLNEKSGLLGISGLSSDMREILGAMKLGNKRARLAFEMYIHRLQSSLGSMVAVLGGLDVLVFTAGIGEHSPEVRFETCSKLGFLGLKLDPQRNLHPSSDEDISSTDSMVRVLVIRAQEEWAIARACWRIVHETD